MSKRVIVVGLGRFGSALAQSLTQHGCQVIAVDADMACVDAIKDGVGYALQLDGGDPLALRSVDAHTCSLAVVAIGENFEGAALSVAAMREIGVQQIVARALTPRHGRILQAIGATRILELEAEMGRTLGQQFAASLPG